MSLQTFPCPNGEICYAEECTQARQCMHIGKAQHSEQLGYGTEPEEDNRLADVMSIMEALKSARAVTHRERPENLDGPGVVVSPTAKARATKEKDVV